MAYANSVDPDQTAPSYANSVDPDQTAPTGAVWSGSTLFAIPLNISRNNCIKKQNLGQKCTGIRKTYGIG